MNEATIETSLAAKMLRRMVQLGGSDLFITAYKPASARIDGNIQNIGTDTPLSPEETESIVYGCMEPRSKKEFDETQNANFSIELSGCGRFRVNAFRQRCHAGIVARHINTEVPTLEGLGMPNAFADAAMQKRGLILMVGPTGSGKSTTLAAMINHRNETEAGHIITMEDPIEYVHEHKAGIVMQREVGTDTPDFHSGLKAALRQDPDAILLGEIRDKELMGYGLEFSNTGHLCFATLHANNAPQAIDRVVRLFPAEERESARFSIAENLYAILSQRLIENKEGKRTAALEILINTPHIADLISEDKINEVHESMAEDKMYGMQTFDQHFVELVKNEIITPEQAIQNADSKNNVRLALKSIGASTPESSSVLRFKR